MKRLQNNTHKKAMPKNLDFNTDILEDRDDASMKLLEILPTQKMQDEDWLIVAISLQAVPIAEKIAKKLKLYYDILFTEPILAPSNSECEIAMVSESQEIVIHKSLIESFGIEIEYVYGEALRKYEEKILKYVYRYRKGELIKSLKNRNILLVDEGCETGIVALTSIKTAMKSGASSVIYATPLIATNVALDLENVADEVYTVFHTANFVNVDFYYKENEKLSSSEIKRVVEESQHYLPFRKIPKQEK